MNRVLTYIDVCDKRQIQLLGLYVNCVLINATLYEETNIES